MPWKPVTQPSRFDFKLFIHQHGFRPDPLNNLLQSNGAYRITITPKGATSIKITKGKPTIFNGLMPASPDQALLVFQLLKII